MLIKTLILGGQNGLAQMFGCIFEANHGAPLFTELTDQRAIFGINS